MPDLVRGLWSRWLAWRKRPARDLPGEVTWLAVVLAAFAAYGALRPDVESLLEQVRIKRGTMMLQEPPRSYDQPFRQARGNRRDAHIFLAANMGSIYCVAGNPLPQSALLRGDLAQEEYPSDPEKATVKRRSWTPNAIELEVDAKVPTTIFINQNWAPEWRSSVGTVKSHEQLLAIDVPAGQYTMEVAYRDRFLTVCLLVSLATLLGVLYVFGRAGWTWLQGERPRWKTLPTWPDEDADGDGPKAAGPKAAEPAKPE